MPETTATPDHVSTLQILPVPSEGRIDPDEGKYWLSKRLNEYFLLLEYGLRVAPGPADVAWSILLSDIRAYTNAAREAVLGGGPVRVERESEQDTTHAEAARDLRRLLEDYSSFCVAEGEDCPGATRAYAELCREYNRRCPDACWPVPDSGPEPEGSDDAAEPEEPAPHSREVSEQWARPEAPANAPEAARLREAFEAQREFVDAVEQDLSDLADRIASRHGALLRAYGRDPISGAPPVPERPGRAGARTEAIARRHGAPEPAA